MARKKSTEMPQGPKATSSPKKHDVKDKEKKSERKEE